MHPTLHETLFLQASGNNSFPMAFAAICLVLVATITISVGCSVCCAIDRWSDYSTRRDDKDILVKSDTKKPGFVMVMHQPLPASSKAEDLHKSAAFV